MSHGNKITSSIIYTSIIMSNEYQKHGLKPPELVINDPDTWLVLKMNLPVKFLQIKHDNQMEYLVEGIRIRYEEKE